MSDLYLIVERRCGNRQATNEAKMVNNRSTETRRLALVVVVLRTEPVEVRKTMLAGLMEDQRVGQIRLVIRRMRVMN